MHGGRKTAMKVFVCGLDSDYGEALSAALKRAGHAVFGSQVADSLPALISSALMCDAVVADIRVDQSAAVTVLEGMLLSLSLSLSMTAKMASRGFGDGIPARWFP